MTTIRKGLFVELVDRAHNKIIFAAATDELDRASFDELWKTIGATVYRGALDRSDLRSFYELRVSPITS